MRDNRKKPKFRKITEEEAEGSEASKTKPKRCKWKLQARNIDKSINHKNRPLAMQRTSGEITWDNPKTKSKKKKKWEAQSRKKHFPL